ncbi:MAG: hypothetical protein ACYTFT_03135 [Planctomycetota bacterium]|jgi:hypothetical protein
MSRVLGGPALLAALGVFLVAGCSAPQQRTIPWGLGQEATARLTNAKAKDALVRPQQGELVIPLVPGAERLVVQEPGKPPLICEGEVWVDPSPELEDRYHYSAQVNVVIAKVAGTETIGSHVEGEVVIATAEPLSLLRTRTGAPWFLPASGQGVVVVTEEPAHVWAGEQEHVMSPIPGGAAPLVLELPPGPVTLRVEQGRRVALRREINVTEGAYQLLGVRLGNPKPIVEGDQP